MAMEIETIKDTIFFFSKSVAVKFVVSLASQDKNTHGRRYFYNEYEYDSRYSDCANVISVNRNFAYYLMIENRAVLNGAGNIRISQGDMPKLRSTLNTVARWFMDSSMKIFSKRSGKLFITSQGKTKSELIQLGQFAAMSFEPAISEFEDGSESIGVRILLGDTSNTVCIPVDRFMAFYDFIQSLDMYGTACTIVSSIHLSDAERKKQRHRLDNVGGSRREYGDTPIKPKAKNFFDN